MFKVEQSYILIGRLLKHPNLSFRIAAATTRNFLSSISPYIRLSETMVCFTSKVILKRLFQSFYLLLAIHVTANPPNVHDSFTQIAVVIYKCLLT